jgi:hypothetical protein
MKPLILSLLVVLLGSCQNSTPSKANKKPNRAQLIKSISGSKKCLFYFEDFTEIGKKLNIKIGEQKQQIILLPFKANLSELEFTDWNFDGVLDISVKDKASSGSGGDVHQVWLFDETLNSFILWEDVSGRLSIKLDAKRKLIIGGYREGWNYEVIQEYRVVDNKLKLKKSIEITRGQNEKGEPWEKKSINN